MTNMQKLEVLEQTVEKLDWGLGMNVNEDIKKKEEAKPRQLLIPKRI